MLKIEYFICVWTAMMSSICGMGDMGEGKWTLVSVSDCDERDLADVEGGCEMTVTHRKHNRTLDLFDLAYYCEHDLDDTYGALLVICKHVDGGCKEWQVLADDNLPHFTKKYADENLKRLLEMTGLDPPDYPIKAGNLSVSGYYLNYCEFPKKSVYGTFEVLSFLTKNGKKMGCVKSVVQFDEDTEGYTCD